MFKILKNFLIVIFNTKKHWHKGKDNKVFYNKNILYEIDLYCGSTIHKIENFKIIKYIYEARNQNAYRYINHH